MKKENGLASGVSETAQVNEFMKVLDYPNFELVEYLRELILSCSKDIGEGIYWNAPVFYYTGKMKPFNPKDYSRYLVGFNLFKKDCVRLIFLRGAGIADPKNILEGDYKDGRRLTSFKNMADIKNKENELKKILKLLLATLKKDQL